jgi:hydrogenase maturation protease
MTPPILIIAIGNESRGDDALAPLLLRRLEAWLATREDRARVELLEEFQLQVEHAMDLLERELVLFIDAGIGTPAPCSFCRAAAHSDGVLFSHALAPEALLATFAQVYGQPAPPAFVLCLRGEQFELGSGMSAAAERGMETAFGFVRELLGETGLQAWESRCGVPVPDTTAP